MAGRLLPGGAVLGDGGVGLRLEVGPEAGIEGGPQSGRLAGPGPRPDLPGLAAQADQSGHGRARDLEAGGEAVVRFAGIDGREETLAEIAGVGFHDQSVPQRQLLRQTL